MAAYKRKRFPNGMKYRLYPDGMVMVTQRELLKYGSPLGLVGSANPDPFDRGNRASVKNFVRRIESACDRIKNVIGGERG